MSSEDRDHSSTEMIRRPSPLPWLLLVLVLLVSGGVIYLQHDVLESERSRSASALKASDEATGARKALADRVTELESEKTKLTAHAGVLSEELEEKEAELAKLKATYDSLEEKMKAEIQKGDIRVTQTNGKIRVDLVDKILFDSGEADLSARGQEVLGRLGAVLSKIEDKAIQVSGHTDDSPITDPALAAKYPTNWELSVARAVNVVRCLSDKGEVPSGRLVAAGYGEFHPIAANATPAGRARNRRIEILLTPTLDTRRTPTPLAAKEPAKKEPPKVVTAKVTPPRAVAVKAPAKVAVKKKK